MSDVPKTTQQPTQPKAMPIVKLLVQSSNPHGIRLPFPGPNGGNDHMAHTISAGEQGPDVLFEIEFRPWLRHHFVTRSVLERASEKSAEKKWKRTHMFMIHETMVIPVPADA